jgi:hypothetical protein
MGKRNEEFVLILDIDRVFSAKELEAVQAAEGGAREQGEEEK